MFNARVLLNLGLVITLAALVAVALYEPGIEKQATPEKITQILAKNIESISVHNSGADPINLSKHNNTWQLVSPGLHNGKALPANKWRVEQMIQLVESPVIMQLEAKPDQLKEFGLDNPRLTVTLNNIEIAFGEQEPIKSRRYLKIDNTVYLIENSLYMQFVASAIEMVDTALLPDNPTITELNLPDLTLVKQADGKWLSTPPVTVSYDIINTLMDEWRFAQAMEISLYHQQPAIAHIKLHLEKGDTISFALIQKEPEFVLARIDLGLEYRFTKNTADRLLTLAKPEETTKP